MITAPSPTDAKVTPERSRELLTALADYHGLRIFIADSLIRGTEKQTIAAFYQAHPECACPSPAILMCIIEDLKRPKQNWHR